MAGAVHLMEDSAIEALLEAPVLAYHQRKDVKMPPPDDRRSERRRSEERDHCDDRRYSREDSRGDDRDRRRSEYRDDRRHSEDREYRRVSEDHHERRVSHVRSRSPKRDKPDERRVSLDRSRSPKRDKRDERRISHDRSRSPKRELFSDATRDRRTVFVRQLAQRVREANLRELCEKVGPVHEVKLVVDRKTGRSKGVAFVEFEQQESIYRAIGLSGTPLMGIPIIVEITETEKNRLAAESAQAAKQAREMARQPTVPVGQISSSNCRLRVSGLHPHLGEPELRAIFEPFGDLIRLDLQRGDATQCHAYLQYRYPGDAQAAIKQMDGFNLAGTRLQVTWSAETMTSLGEGPVVVGSSSSSRPEEQLLHRVAREAASLKSQVASPYLDLSIGLHEPEMVRSELLKYGQILQWHALEGRLHVHMGNQMAAERALTAFATGASRLTCSGRFMSLEEWTQLYTQ